MPLAEHSRKQTGYPDMAAQHNSSNPPRTIIFDLGKVIVDFDHMTFCTNLAPFCAEPAAAVYERIFRSGLATLFDSGKLPPSAFFKTVRTELSFTIDMACFSWLWCDIFTLQEGMEPLLKSLSGSYRLLCLSNTNPWHFNWCRQRFDLLHLFDDFILSFEEHCCKPVSSIYKKALVKAQAPAERCLFFDDNVDNVAAAKLLGINAFVFTTIDTLLQNLSSSGIACQGSSG